MNLNDEDIKKYIVDEIYWDSRIAASKIKVTVENGVLTLAGDVPTYRDRAVARAVARRIEGVLNVIDNITVRYESPPELPKDADIRMMAENILSWDPTVDEDVITVSVAGGLVTLEGTVDAHWKKPFVEEKIIGLRGIVAIENKLAVVPSRGVVDERIAEDVVAALDRDSEVDPEVVTVEVDNGVVSLFGTVASLASRDAAERDASYTAGVSAVNNNLTVAV